MLGLDDVVTFYRTFRATVESLETIRKWKADKIRTVTALQSQIHESEVEYGSDVKIRGTVSDFVPISKNIVFESESTDSKILLDSLASKPISMDSYHCGLLQEDHIEYAGSPEGIPIFYENDASRPITEYLTGEIAIIEGRLISLPSEWNQFLDLSSPVGLHVNSINPIRKKRDYFGIYYWKVVRNNDIGLKVGGGNVMMVGDLWMMTARLDETRVLAVNSWGNEFRHGRPDERGENVGEFYKSNFMDKDLVQGQTNHLDSRFEDAKIDASWDMTRKTNQHTDWVSNQISSV